MATARDIQLRIRSIQNIAKVTGALEAVAAVKVHHAQQQALSSRPYIETAQHLMRSIVSPHLVSTFDLLKPRSEVNRIAVLLITSDRGLAGAYNVRIVNMALDFEQEQSAPVHYYIVGRKGQSIMARRKADVAVAFGDIPSRPSVDYAHGIARVIESAYTDRHCDIVYLLYTRFVNLIEQEPVIKQLLPVIPEQNSDSPTIPTIPYSYEPDEEAVLEELVPHYVENVIFQALLEAVASEHAARMTAMHSATNNANDLVDELTLSYNKARQLAITSEMLDIVGGSEALSQSNHDQMLEGSEN
ncbi:MAG: ATP synthase F1 subunit gamma [Anaerolineae bacterium]|nr:ATP synthase F1 subunit gamma [Anaerolineae bacterium]